MLLTSHYDFDVHQRDDYRLHSKIENDFKVTPCRCFPTSHETGVLSDLLRPDFDTWNSISDGLKAEVEP